MSDRALFASAFSCPVAVGGPEEEAVNYRPHTRSMAFSVRLTAEERAIVDAAASRCELASGTWAKTALLEAARRFLEELGT